MNDKKIYGHKFAEGIPHRLNGMAVKVNLTKYVFF